MVVVNLCELLRKKASLLRKTYISYELQHDKIIPNRLISFFESVNTFIFTCPLLGSYNCQKLFLFLGTIIWFFVLLTINRFSST